MSSPIEEPTKPARLGPLRFTEPSIGEDEVQAVVAALRAGHIGGNGTISRRVQDHLAELCGVRRALLTPSATTAMEVALIASGVGPGDEVLMPGFAFVSHANAILSTGAKPIFCDVDPVTLNIDPVEVERKLSPRSKMVMPVHYAGVACDMQPILDLAQRHGISVVEDAAQGINAHWNGRHLGTIGLGGAISFHSTKNIVAGEGGALLTDDEDFARQAEVIQEKGTNRSAFLRGEVDKYTWIGRGGSYVLSDLLAALLEVQLARMGEMQVRRRATWDRYQECLAPLEQAGRLRRPAPPEFAAHNAHIYFILAETPELQDAILVGLREREVQATFHFQPLHASPYARDVLGLTEPLPVSERSAATIVRLPLHDGVTPEDAERVASAIEEICAQN